MLIIKTLREIQKAVGSNLPTNVYKLEVSCKDTSIMLNECTCGHIFTSILNNQAILISEKNINGEVIMMDDYMENNQIANQIMSYNSSIEDNKIDIMINLEQVSRYLDTHLGELKLIGKCSNFMIQIPAGKQKTDKTTQVFKLLRGQCQVSIGVSDLDSMFNSLEQIIKLYTSAIQDQKQIEYEMLKVAKQMLFMPEK
jgi:hypothetical protein